MDVRSINRLLSQGTLDHPELWPHVREKQSQAIQFRFEFGLNQLPLEPGLITIRGPRQYGKSTWLEENLYETIKTFGKGAAYYLNGDEIASEQELIRAMIELEGAYPKDKKTKRLFIDEVTAIPAWEKAIKILRDRGAFRDVLIVTTGSKAFDLRRGSERLPGRKGRLVQSDYIFLPISYPEFHRKCGLKFREKSWMAYLLGGGSPIAFNELYQSGTLPDFFIQLTRDWIFGEIIASGRSRLSLTNLLQVIFRTGGTPVGFAKIAREAGLANNTVAAGYIEGLSDLFCLVPSWPWDENRDILQPRKPCKFHFINLSAVIALHPSSLRRIREFENLVEEQQGLFIEWLVAQEIWRRSILRDRTTAEFIGFWAAQNHEIDFVTPQKNLIEVKRGHASPLDFSWFKNTFPKKNLTVICSTPFETSHVRGITLEDFLMKSDL